MSQPLVNKPEDLIGAGGDLRASDLFDADFVAHIENMVRGQLPEEKKAAQQRQIGIAKELHEEGSVVNRVMGQKLGSVDSRTYFRWQREDPNFWKDPIKVERFLMDNPQCRSKGWKPKYHHVDKGITFVGGIPVSPMQRITTG